MNVNHTNDVNELENFRKVMKRYYHLKNESVIWLSGEIVEKDLLDNGNVRIRICDPDEDFHDEVSLDWLENEVAKRRRAYNKRTLQLALALVGLFLCFAVILLQDQIAKLLGF